MTTPVLEEPQKSLFDLNGKEFNPNWIDPLQPLLVPANPLHVKAHRLQILLDRLDIQASKNGAQFNSASYLSVLNEYIKSVQMINEGKTGHDLLDEKSVDPVGERDTTPTHSDVEPISMDSGIPTLDPTPGQGANPA